MKIGYPCINLSLDCPGNKTFRLKSYSEKKIIETVENNLNCLREILKFNAVHSLYFFRITSDLIPFASHPVCVFNWQRHFEDELKNIGNFIKQNGIRISMHPDQFTLINTPDRRVYDRSVSELLYHSKVLDCMGLDLSAKIQIHIGGVYKSKKESIARFIRRYKNLDTRIRNRLVIENDDRSYSLRDCIHVHESTGIPVLFDVFHHEILNTRESIEESFGLFTTTWNRKDGIPMVDYSTQEAKQRVGAHARTINADHFRSFLENTRAFDFDIILEIKDKEKSALKAIAYASNDNRIKKANKHISRHYG